MTQPAGPRAYHPDGRAALADICVRTADNGCDSRHLYPDPELMPSIFAAPYVYLEPDLAFVIDDGTGRAVGHIVGDRRHGALRDGVPQAVAAPRSGPIPGTGRPAAHPQRGNDRPSARPGAVIVPELAAHPAHLHIDLLPAWQRKGL